MSLSFPGGYKVRRKLEIRAVTFNTPPPAMGKDEMDYKKRQDGVRRRESRLFRPPTSSTRPLRMVKVTMDLEHDQGSKGEGRECQLVGKSLSSLGNYSAIGF